MPAFNTPLRYPGGKGRLARYITQLIELNDLRGGAYVEPYAGGAGVAMSLLLSGIVGAIHLNDISQPIFAFWKATLDHTDALCKLIADTPVSMEEWHRQRRVLERAAEYSTLQLGFATFFLNRTNRSGIIRGGVIGGKGQEGTWTLDARYNKADLISRIKAIASCRDRIHLYSVDAVQFITGVLAGIPERSLIYLDPPYYVKGGGLYEHHYGHDDHEEIAGLVQNVIHQPWIVSYDDHPAIRQLYLGRRQQEFSLHYSAHRRFQGQELMIFSDGLVMPPQVTPSRASVS
jgi:DNA adenine methylase